MTAPATAPERTAGAGHSFRPDIEGLRAIAVLAVVAFHAGIPWVGGGFVGVDVFYVLSGFLITSLLISEVERTGRVSLSRFWARRARRLLPAACIVLMITAVASALVLSPLVRGSVRGGFVASSLYVANWWFARQGTDYLAQDDAPSPVQHYWSLGVEEQFYLLWPVLVLLIVLWLRVPAERRAQFVLRRLLPLVGLTWVLSFAWEVHETSANQPYAFFGTPARAWELATGALAAVLARQLSTLPARGRAVLGWAGLIALLGSVVLLAQTRLSGPYPGTYALWPALGTVALVVSGMGVTTGRGPGHLLSNGPLRWVGRMSYSWYLWHWPPLVLLPVLLGRPLHVPEAVLVSIVALGFAWATYHLIEQPFRFARVLLARPWLSLATGAGLTLVALVVSLVLLQTPAASGSTAATVSAGGDSPSKTVQLVEGPAAAAKDASPLLGNGCQVHSHTAAPKDGCTFGDPLGTKDVFLLGDSHASQWFPALNEVSKQEHWRLTAWTKGACPFIDAALSGPDGGVYTECRAWLREVLRRVDAAHPDLVIVSSATTSDNRTYAASASAQRKAWVEGLSSALKQLAAKGTSVVWLQDTPSMAVMVPDCLAQNHSDADCSQPRSKSISKDHPDVEAARAAGVPVIDLADAICGPDVCHAIVGNTIVWLDRGHLTAAFSATLSDELHAALKTAGVAP